MKIASNYCCKIDTNGRIIWSSTLAYRDCIYAARGSDDSVNVYPYQFNDYEKMADIKADVKLFKKP